MNLGNILLAAFLILFGVAALGVPIPLIITGIVALLAGILLLVGR